MNTVQFRHYECELEVRRYSNGRPALQLRDSKDGSPVAVATVNLPGLPIPGDCVAIKDYSENEGMLDALMQQGVVGKPISYVTSGFVRIPICPLLVSEGA